MKPRRSLVACCLSFRLPALWPFCNTPMFSPLSCSAARHVLRASTLSLTGLVCFAALGIVLAARVPLEVAFDLPNEPQRGCVHGSAATRGTWFALVIVVALGTTASIIVRNNPDKRPGTVRLIGVFAIAAVLCHFLRWLPAPDSRNSSAGDHTNRRPRHLGASSPKSDTCASRPGSPGALARFWVEHQEGRVQAFGQIQYEGTSTNNVTSDWVLGWSGGRGLLWRCHLSPCFSMQRSVACHKLRAYYCCWCS